MRSAATRRKAADVSGTHLWLVLMKAHRALERLATRSIESLEVCLSDFGIMELLLHKGPQPVNEIGRRIALTSGAITTAVDRLEARGLVRREAHESDRRGGRPRAAAGGGGGKKKGGGAPSPTKRGGGDGGGPGPPGPARATLIALLKKLGIS